MQEHCVNVFADYYQFYLWDPTAPSRAPDDYSDEDVRRRVKVGPNVVVIQPVRNTEVPVTLRRHDVDPGFDAARFEQIVECMIEVPGGQIQIHESTGGPVLDLDVEPGSYCVRVLCAGLATLSEDGLQGDDRYLIDIWPGRCEGVRVVKQFG